MTNKYNTDNKHNILCLSRGWRAGGAEWEQILDGFKLRELPEEGLMQIVYGPHSQTALPVII